MNKIIKTILLLIIIFTFIGCNSKTKESLEVLINGTKEITIDGIKYCNTNETVDESPKQNTIEHIEASTGTSPVIKAYAIIQNDKLVYCQIDGKWYKFLVYYMK